eukprot:GHVU01085088.1.p1 GENE.GHVU01085088.1~~GHVU01085088.1.p1  ORF type:complete len:127 (+),score=11.00 GHVU01085088.1:270-650(+)
MLTTDASMTAGSGCARGLLHSFKADGCTLLALVSSHAAASDVSVEEGQQESDAATCLLGELKALTVMKQYLPKSVMKIRCKMDCGLPMTCVDVIRMLAQYRMRRRTGFAISGPLRSSSVAESRWRW